MTDQVSHDKVRAAMAAVGAELEAERRARIGQMGPCRPCNYATVTGLCSRPGRAFICGPRCPAHTPAALAGHREVRPDPDLTMEGLRRAWYADRDLPYLAPPLLAITDTLIDDRNIASGKKRASPERYRAAKAATFRDPKD